MRHNQIFSENAYLKSLYQRECRKMRFCAKNVEEAKKWQQRLRSKLADIFGGFPEKCSLKAKIVDEKDCGKFIQQTVHYQSEPNVTVCAYCLIPKKISFPCRTVICQHGHGFGKDDVMGYDHGNEEHRNWIEQCNYPYACYFADRGYVVIAPDARCFGQRRDGADILPPDCYFPMLKSVLLGKSLNGQRTWDLIRTLDYLETRPEVDKNSIGYVGFSLGGQLGIYLGALDERVKVVCISGFLVSFLHSLLAEQHCNCSYDPGLLKYADISDLAGLISPRPLLIEAGSNDPSFPAKFVLEAFEELEHIYHIFNAGNCVDIDVFGGGHCFSGHKCFDWFDRWL